jgi:hypothetical protein
MPSVYRVTAVWSGFQGAPGYSKFSFQDLTTDAARNAAGAAIRTLFDATKAYMQSGWTVNVQPNVQEYDIGNSELVGEGSMTTTPAVVTGTATGTVYAGGSGYVITWRTSTIFNGHRCVGRTFMVPAVNCFGTDGTIDGGALTTIQAAGSALVANPTVRLSVWSKQFNKADPPVQIAGANSAVTSCVVKDMASGLRSRRT